MRVAAIQIGRFVAGLTVESFLADQAVQRAVERDLEIIGQAALRVSREFRDQHLELPWAPIIAQRNVLAHQYGDIDFNRIWRVATIDVPELIRALDLLLPPPPPDE